MKQLEIPRGLRGQDLTAWLVNKRDELLLNICQDPLELEKFVRLWDSNLGLHEYSINNIILAYFQYPRLSMLAGFRKFQSLGRTVVKGSRAIKVLAPLKTKRSKENEDGKDEEYYIYGWRNVNVFDISMTQGDNLDFGHSDMVKGESISFNEIIKISPLPVVVEYKGTANGSVNSERIQIAPKDNELSMIASFCHEICHYYLGHIYSDLDRETKEVEAEIASFCVTAYLGIENEKSKYYLGHWNKNGTKLENRAAKVIKVAEKIIRDLQKLQSEKEAD